MYGAILGDMIGAPFEFDRGHKAKDFELFGEGVEFTDDSVMTVAVAEALLKSKGKSDEAFYGIPEDMIAECRDRLPGEMLKVVDAFEKELAEASKFHDPFLAGNEIIEQAIKNYNVESTPKNLQTVLDVIRQRMHEDGHLMIPVSSSKSGEEFVFKMVQADDGNSWPVAFTTPNEYRKGEPSEILSHYISELLKSCLRMNCPGIMLNPWGESFTLTREMMEAIIRADEGVEYSVPEESITPELLEGGAYLKRAVEICKRNWTVMNSIKLLKILRDSYVWIPCEAVVSDTLQDTLANAIEIAERTGNNEALKAVDLTGMRMIPNIFSRDDGSYFPVFTTTEEMGEYGESVSKMERHFLEAVCLARNNKKDVKGIVINAFTDSLVLTLDLCEVIKEIKEV